MSSRREADNMTGNQRALEKYMRLQLIYARILSEYTSFVITVNRLPGINVVEYVS